MEFYMTFHILGISSSQLTKSYFFRGVGQPPTKAILLMVNLGMVYDGFWWFMINFLNSIYQFADQVLQL
jgi:hypothetical protein